MSNRGKDHSCDHVRSPVAILIGRVALPPRRLDVIQTSELLSVRFACTFADDKRLLIAARDRRGRRDRTEHSRGPIPGPNLHVEIRPLVSRSG